MTRGSQSPRPACQANRSPLHHVRGETREFQSSQGAGICEASNVTGVSGGSQSQCNDMTFSKKRIAAEDLQDEE